MLDIDIASDVINKTSEGTQYLGYLLPYTLIAMSLGIEEDMRKVPGNRHIPELQAFRGFASLVVVFLHCNFYYLNTPRYRRFAEGVFNGHAAVVAFFVLSGFVLSRSLTRNSIDLRNVADFYTKRLIRIYPALFFACVLGFTYLLVFGTHPAPSNVSLWWSESQRAKTVSLIRVGAAFFGLSLYLPVPVWSLADELIGSLALPLIVSVILRSRIATSILVFLLFGLSLVYGEKSWMAASDYLIDFAVGACIPLFRERFQFLTRTPLRARLSAFIALVTLWTVRQLGGWKFESAYHAPVPANLEAIAAAVLIGIIASRPNAFPLLQHKWSIWIGDISYSLYLVHMPIMGLVAGIGGEVLGLSLFNHQPIIATAALLICTLLISLPVAAFSYRFIEVPCMLYGKRHLRATLLDPLKLSVWTELLTRTLKTDVNGARESAPRMDTSLYKS